PPPPLLFPYTTLFRSPRVPLPLQLGGVLAVGLPRRGHALGHLFALLLWDDPAARALSGLAEDDRARAAVSVDHPGADRRLSRQRSEEHTSELQSLRHL